MKGPTSESAQGLGSRRKETSHERSRSEWGKDGSAEREKERETTNKDTNVSQNSMNQLACQRRPYIIFACAMGGSGQELGWGGERMVEEGEATDFLLAKGCCQLMPI